MDEIALQLHRRKRLEQAIASLAAGNVTAFGRLLGYRDGAFVRQMLAGTRAVSDKTVRAIEAHYGMGGWFSARPAASMGVAEPLARYEPLSRAPGSGLVVIPTVTLQLRQGMPGYVAVDDTDTDSAAIFPRGWMERKGCRPGDLLAMRVRDASMQPSLHEGGVVVVNTLQVEPVDGQVFVVNDEGACLLRRLVRDRGSWWLVADNPVRFPRKELQPPHAFLIGHVIHQQGETI